MQFGRVIPHILNGLNKNNLGMRRLYETFCINKDKQELALFGDSEVKANVKELTEKYPMTAFQKVTCEDHKQKKKETLELEKEISRELGIDEEPSTDNKHLISEELEEVIFTLEPTLEQREKEKMEADMDLSLTFLDGDLDEDGVKDHWIDDVVGGYYLEDQLDFSHIQDGSFAFNEGGSLTQKLSSIEARPILWMVLFEWKNPNHLDKQIEMNIKEVQMSMHYNDTKFKIQKGNIVDLLDNQMSNMERQSKNVWDDLAKGRLRLNVSSNHRRTLNGSKYPNINRFLRKLEEEIEKAN
jgi:hypothetical protein